MSDKAFVGVISDTHGLMRPEALEALRGSELIVHAGDVDDPRVLERLRTMAPVVAVRGNVDGGPWARYLPRTEAVEVSGTWLYVIHDLNELDLDPVAAGFSAVINGHSHRPSIRMHRGVMLLNPGSAGPRRFSLPVSVARLQVTEGNVSARIVKLRLGMG